VGQGADRREDGEARGPTAILLGEERPQVAAEEAPGRRQEMQKSLWNGAQGALVHPVQVEESVHKIRGRCLISTSSIQYQDSTLHKLEMLFMNDINKCCPSPLNLVFDAHIKTQNLTKLT